MSWKEIREAIKNAPPLTELQKLKLALAREERYLVQVNESLERFRVWSVENQKRARDDREYGTCSDDSYSRDAIIKQIAFLKEKIACLEPENSV